MFTRDIGQNFSRKLVNQIRAEGVEVEVMEQRLSRPIRIKIADVLLYVKYANLNKAGNWYFGFYPKDLADDTFCHYAILLCGENDVVRTYLIPFKEFSSFVRTGTLVESSKRSEQYQSHIFPDRKYVMKMIGNPHSELPMAAFQLHHGSIDSHFVEVLLNKVISR
ncbi:MAG: hypothetical protein HYW01_11440 [Deltaproteobacteria bacterium]|nr:hypothetical protein [Deltaproteobacteria bacterium]